MYRNTSRYRLFGILVVILGIASLFIYWLYRNRDDLTIDAPLERTLQAVPGIASYDQLMQTRAYFSGRELRIDGRYENDLKNSRYASYSTTTLLITGDPKSHIFTHANVSIDKDVYVFVATKDPVLQHAIQQTGGWKHFTGGAIPKVYAGVAIPGPIQDNLQILKDNGAYVKLIKKHGTDKTFGVPLQRYTFALSGKKPTDTSGPLQALVSHIGENGRVDVWIDKGTGLPQYLRLSGDTYVSTTTIQGINEPLRIVSPIGI